MEDRKPVVAVNTSYEDLFEKRCNNLISEGYRLSSSSCGFVQSKEYDFQSVWQAIFVDAAGVYDKS